MVVREKRQLNDRGYGNPSITSFFKIQDSTADIPVSAAVVENADTAEEDAIVSPAVCPNARPKTKETSVEVRQMTLITISFLRPTVIYLSWTNLSLLIGHTFLPLSLLRP